MGCCRHGVVQRAVNMFHGETFRHTNFIHKHMAEKNFKFISSDVICRYWDFSVRTAAKHPELLGKTKETKPFLPRMHAKAHVLHCQVCLALIHSIAHFDLFINRLDIVDWTLDGQCCLDNRRGTRASVFKNVALQQCH